MMYARKVRRKCDVRGCRNIDCFAISKSREPGNSIIICKSCLGEGIEAVEKVGSEPVVKKAIASEPPPLFFSDILNPKKEPETAVDDGSDMAPDGDGILSGVSEELPGEGAEKQGAEKETKADDNSKPKNSNTTAKGKKKTK